MTLYATLTGEGWWPYATIQTTLVLDLISEAARDVSRSGMVEAIRSAVLNAGDFRDAMLTADSYVVIEHRSSRLNGWQGRARIVQVTELPSLDDLVDLDAVSLIDVA